MSIVAKRLDGSGYQFIGTEVGLGPGDIVLDGDSASPFRVVPQFWGREYISATV